MCLWQCTLNDAGDVFGVDRAVSLLLLRDSLQSRLNYVCAEDDVGVCVCCIESERKICTVMSVNKKISSSREYLNFNKGHKVLNIES